jgi:hypothetical protein
MDNFKDYTIFNAVNPNAISPTSKKTAPFPLEFVEEDLINAYMMLSKISGKFDIAKRNPVNQTPAKAKRLKSLSYKLKTAMKLLQEISGSVVEL